MAAGQAPRAAEPPLLAAVQAGRPEALRKLLAAGADVEQANAFGVTPLLQASRQGDAESVRLLLEAGAKADRRYVDGESALMEGAASGSVAAVKLLLAHGADVNAREQDQQQTALMWAAAGGHVEVVQALIAAGADVNLAARPNALEKPGGVGGRNWADFSRGNLTALKFAVREGHAAVVHALLAAHADVNHKAPNGVTALMIAVNNHWLDLAAELVDAGADVNDGSLNELIYVDVRRMNTVMHDGSRPAPVHDNLLTPVALMQKMLDAGADPTRVVHYTFNVSGADLAFEENQSAYGAALLAQDAEALRLLLARRKVDPDKLTGGRVPPLLAAVNGGGFRFGGGVIGAAPNAYRFPGARGLVPSVQVLLEAGASPEATNDKEERAIHFAAQSGNLRLIELLAKHGARLDVPTKAGLTPVELAAGKRPPQQPDPRAAFVPPPVVPHPEAVALLQKLMAAAPAVAHNDAPGIAR
jgi:uncharacterized protein